MNAQTQRISLAAYTPAELKAMRTRLVSQRRKEHASAMRIDKVLRRVAARLDKQVAA